MFRHLIGLAMLRERPFDIYAGQEDVFGPGFFFTTQSCIFYFYIIIIPYSYCPKIIKSVQ